jgi:hypothetical protein
MTRLSAALLPLLVLLLAPLAGCGSSSTGNKANSDPVPVPKKDGTVCSGAAQMSSGSECAGNVCIALLANDQHEPGTCTTSSATANCAAGELCVDGFPDGGSYCLRACTSNADCLDGFACVADSGDQFCWVTATGVTTPDAGPPPDAGTSPGGHVDCTGCDMLGDVPGYCGNAAGTTQVCDCPYGSPSTSCTATPGAANTWCCP